MRDFLQKLFNRNINFKEIFVSKRGYFIAFFVLLVAIFGVISFKKYYLDKNKTTNGNTSTETSDKKKIDISNLSGKVIFQDGENNIYSQEIKTGNRTLLYKYAEGSTMDWSYSDGFVFVFSSANKTVERLNLSTNEKVSINLEFKDAGGAKITPAPDSSKAIILLFNPGIGDTESEEHYYLLDFSKKEANDLKIDINNPIEANWFSDSRFLWRGGDSVLDTSNLRNVSLGDLGVPKSISKVGHGIFWIETEEVDDPLDIFAPKSVPRLRYRDLNFYLPELREPGHGTGEGEIPFIKFPVPGRDYRKIETVVPGKEANLFFLEIDSGRSGIYLTDSYSWGTFKKISPNDAHNYRLLGYEPNINKVMAQKVAYGNPDSGSLVLIDEGNYAETIAEIPEKNYSEVVVTNFSNDIGYIYPQAISFSPDGNYLLIPLDNEPKNTHYGIFSSDGKSSVDLSGTFGMGTRWSGKIYWAKD